MQRLAIAQGDGLALGAELDLALVSDHRGHRARRLVVHRRHVELRVGGTAGARLPPPHLYAYGGRHLEQVLRIVAARIEVLAGQRIGGEHQTQPGSGQQAVRLQAAAGLELLDARRRVRPQRRHVRCMPRRRERSDERVVEPGRRFQHVLQRGVVGDYPRLPRRAGQRVEKQRFRRTGLIEAKAERQILRSGELPEQRSTRRQRTGGVRAPRGGTFSDLDLKGAHERVLRESFVQLAHLVELRELGGQATVTLPAHGHEPARELALYRARWRIERGGENPSLEGKRRFVVGVEYRIRGDRHGVLAFAEAAAEPARRGLEDVKRLVQGRADEQRGIHGAGNDLCHAPPLEDGPGAGRVQCAAVAPCRARQLGNRHVARRKSAAPPEEHVALRGKHEGEGNGVGAVARPDRFAVVGADSPCFACRGRQLLQAVERRLRDAHSRREQQGYGDSRTMHGHLPRSRCGCRVRRKYSGVGCAGELATGPAPDLRELRVVLADGQDDRFDDDELRVSRMGATVVSDIHLTAHRDAISAAHHDLVPEGGALGSAW